MKNDAMGDGDDDFKDMYDAIEAYDPMSGKAVSRLRSKNGEGIRHDDGRIRLSS